MGVEDLNTCGKSSRSTCVWWICWPCCHLCTLSWELRWFSKAVQWARNQEWMLLSLVVPLHLLHCCSHLSSSHTWALWLVGERVPSLCLCCPEICVSWPRGWRFLQGESALKQEIVSVCGMWLSWDGLGPSGVVILCWGVYWWGWSQATEQICSFIAGLELLERKITPFSREVVLVGWKPLKGNCHINWWLWSERVGGAGEEFELELQEANKAALACSQGKPRRNTLVFNRYLNGHGHGWWLGRKGCRVRVGSPQQMEQIPGVHQDYSSCMCPPWAEFLRGKHSVN